MIQKVLRLYGKLERVNQVLANRNLPPLGSKYYRFETPPRFRWFPPGISQVYITVLCDISSPVEQIYSVDILNNPHRTISRYSQDSEGNVWYHPLDGGNKVLVPRNNQGVLTIRF